jgi:hypothetical protein
MAWQPSRFVPGLAQYLAAKGMAVPPKDCGSEVPRQDAARPEPSPTASLMQLDATSICIKPELQPPYPPAKRVKTDAHAQSRRPLSSASEADDFRSDPTPAVPCSAVSSAKSIDDLPPLLRSSLLPFQEEGVAFAIQRGGRVMIADDMGLGSRTLPPTFVFPFLFPLFLTEHAFHRQRPFKLFPCAGCCATTGLCSSSCRRACAQHGPRSWSAGCLRFIPDRLRCGAATIPPLLRVPPANLHACAQCRPRRHRWHWHCMRVSSHV